MARVPVEPTAREAEMRSVVADFEASGLSLEEYSRRRGVRASLVAWYQRELQYRDRVRSEASGQGTGAVATAAPVKRASAVFVEVVGSGSMPRGGSGVRLRGGQEVEVDSGFDRGTLVEVVRALEGSC